MALTQEDAHNLIVLLNRVSTTGIAEAKLLGVLANKLEQIKGSYIPGGPSGEDASTTDE